MLKILFTTSSPLVSVIVCPLSDGSKLIDVLVMGVRERLPQ